MNSTRRNRCWLALGCLAGCVLFNPAARADLPDAAAIQEALDAADPGTVVNLPAGRIELDRPLRLPAGVTLAGAGREETVLHYAGDAAAVLVLDGVDRVTLRDFAVSGLDGGAGLGVQVTNGRNHRLENLRVQHLANAEHGPIGIAFTRDVTDSLITGCHLSDIGVASEWGAGIRLSWGSSRNRVENNTVVATGRGGILANDGCTDLVVRGNTVVQTGLAGDGLDYGLGIELWKGSHDSVVEDNRLDRWLSIDASDRVAVRRNTVDTSLLADQDTGPIQDAFIGLELVDSRGVVFADNAVEPGTHLGISVSGHGLTEHALFLRNRVTGADTWAVQLQGDDTPDRRLYFRENTLTRTTPDANTLYREYGPQGDAIRLNSHVSHAVFDRNRVTRNPGHAFDLLQPGVEKLTFIRNQVERNGDNTTPRSDLKPGPRLTLTADPAVPTVGQPVTFSLQPVDAQTVLWDAGAGPPGLTDTAEWSHTYAAPGAYRAAVVAWTADGRASFAQAAVEVIGDAADE